MFSFFLFFLLSIFLPPYSGRGILCFLANMIYFFLKKSFIINPNSSYFCVYYDHFIISLQMQYYILHLCLFHRFDVCKYPLYSTSLAKSLRYLYTFQWNGIITNHPQALFFFFFLVLHHCNLFQNLI